MMPCAWAVRPSTDVGVRIWRLRCDGMPAGSYTDHCNRPVVAGDMLRDDHDHRRRVISRPSEDELVLIVSEPDGARAAPSAIR